MSEHILILTRHGQSEYNEKNLFTGFVDAKLTEQGIEEAKAAGRKLKSQLAERGIQIEAAFTSKLSRAATTCQLILGELGQVDMTPTAHFALNERCYGDLEGLNKDEARQKWGDEQVHEWRRSYTTQPPNGESMRDTVARVLPYYTREVLPVVLENKATLVTAHGNSLRSLIMMLDNETPETIPGVQLETGEARLYVLSDSGRVLRKEIL